METLDYKRYGSKGGIYAIRNKINNKLYIGTTFHFISRRSQHFTQLKRGIHNNSYLQRSWNKYGEENFEFLILEVVNESILFEIEYNYIKKYNVLDHSLGYNLQIDSRGGVNGKHSLETKKKISDSTKGKLKGILPKNLDSIRLLQMRPVDEYFNGIYIRTHESNYAAGLFHNIDYKTINNQVRGITKTIRILPGITFKYEDGQPTRKTRRKK